MGVMVAIAAVLQLAHTLEVIVWAVAYHIVQAAAPGTDMLYFAFVNYTTLGYGDITPVAEWRLLGPLTAMNGVLLFGWSAAILFEVLRKTLDHIGLIPVPESDLQSSHVPPLAKSANVPAILTVRIEDPSPPADPGSAG